MNISVGKVKMDDTDLMIRELLQKKETLKSFINASLKDGVPIAEIKSQLKFYDIKSCFLKPYIVL